MKQLIPWEKNSRKISDKKFNKLVTQIKEKGFAVPIIINTDNVIIAGHQRRQALIKLGREDEDVLVMIPDRKLSEQEFKELSFGDNINIGEYDFDMLKDHFEFSDLLDSGFDELDINLDNKGTDDNNSSSTKDSSSKSSESSSGEKMVMFEISIPESTRDLFLDTINYIKTHKGATNTADAIFMMVKNYPTE